MIDIEATTNWGPVRVLYLPEPVSLDTQSTIAPGLSGRIEAEGEIESAPAYEERYFIGGELAEGVYLQRQLLVRVWLEGADFVAEQPQLRLHSFGASSMEAIYALRDEIVSHYLRLEEMGDRLSPKLLRDRDLLRRLLGKDG